MGAASFIWLFSLLLLPDLLLLSSFYQRGLAGLEGAKKELGGGPELLAARDELWEDRAPRPGAHSGSLSVCVSGSVLGPGVQ